MNNKAPLTVQQQRRFELAEFVDALRPRRATVQIVTVLTKFFRHVGVLDERGQWRHDYETPAGAMRFARLAAHFGPEFAVALAARHTLAREAFLDFCRTYLTSEEKELDRRREMVQRRKESEQQQTTDRTQFIETRIFINNMEKGAIRGRRAHFITYLRRRKGPCQPTRMYRRWRGYEDEMLKWARVNNQHYDPTRPPAKHYRVRGDVERVLGVEAVPLIYKAPLTTREELATAIEELP